MIVLKPHLLQLRNLGFVQLKFIELNVTLAFVIDYVPWNLIGLKNMSNLVDHLTM